MQLDDLLQHDNLAEHIGADELAAIGSKVVTEYRQDLSSREAWEDRMGDSFKLALQVMERKSFPWDGASNVKFPLLTIACLQFQSRAYPALISGPDVVKCRVVGEDETGTKRGKAKRVSEHMSYQVMEEDEDWEAQMDQLLMSLPIVGCGFKKSYFDPARGHNVSRHVLAKDLVVDYYTRSLESAQRITEVIQMTPNEIRENDFISYELSPTQPESSSLDNVRDQAQGMNQPIGAGPRTVLEQHRYLDLDDDGYEEPYVVTVDYQTGKVFRIARRFEEADIKIDAKGDVRRITPTHFYTKYSFIPSPDGGFYDLGFGVLLGPVNESVNTLINQLIDGGTLHNLQGGFLGRGVRIKDGVFKPFEWKHTNHHGDDLRKAIVPLPTREPSQVLLALLQLMINYGERMGSITDAMVGVNPGQNQPATTTMTVMEQGMKVLNGIFKRVYRGLRDEFRKLYKLNQLYLNPNTYYTILDSGEQDTIGPTDYSGDPTDIRPAADPNVSSDAQRLLQAEALAARAAQNPGMYNAHAVERRYLEAMRVPSVEEILPDPNGPNAIPRQPDPDFELKRAELELRATKDQKDSQIKMLNLQIMMEKTAAEIEVLETQAILNLSKAETQEGERELEKVRAVIDAKRVAMEEFRAQIEALKYDGTGTNRLEGSSGNEAAVQAA